MRVGQALWIACPTILFVVMFGHMTGIVNVALVVLAIGTLGAAFSADRPSVLRWPLMVPVLAWAAWTAGAVAWSVWPKVSLHAWFDEVLYPLVAFWAFWLVGSRAEQPARLALVTWVACLLLAIMSALNWGHLQPPTPETFPLHYYNRVGHTSTLAIFAIPVISGLILGARRRLAGLVGLVACLFVGLATLNRFFWPAVVVTLLVALFPLYRKRMLLASVLVLAVIVAGVGTLELSARLRFGNAAPPPAQHVVVVAGHTFYVPASLSGIDDTVSSDTRPKLWAFYSAVGKSHTWTGIGFGKPLPGMAYRAQMPASLLNLEPQAPTHAHNLFLNTWLQTGVIGVMLQSLLLLCLVLRFWRFRRTATWVCAAGIALVAGMIAKNLTDDFMWQTTMLAFWSFAGLLLGSGERKSHLLPPARSASSVSMWTGRPTIREKRPPPTTMYQNGSHRSDA
ncbi:O-antigen ligase family protein [Paraburkholderia gardini]|uniref:O-antigen ligase family protein n=1 Tax=Paraburkholderia gardini TaxID=2823469 RepID=UPI001E138977|nr:hypothetical protein R69919_05001 [Paraburkholderia gardini]